MLGHGHPPMGEFSPDKRTGSLLSGKPYICQLSSKVLCNADACGGCLWREGHDLVSAVRLTGVPL